MICMPGTTTQPHAMKTNGTKGPADLFKILNPNGHPSPSVSSAASPTLDDNRDSAYFSSNSNSSKHTSSASFAGPTTISPTSPGDTLPSAGQDAAPSPVPSARLPEHPQLPQLSHLHTTTANMTVASMVSTSLSSGLQHRRSDISLLTGYPDGHLFQHDSTSTSLAPVGLDSRRGSVDNRVNQRFEDMRLTNSPYSSHYPSNASLRQTPLAVAAAAPLAHHGQRIPRQGPVSQDALSLHRHSNGYQPNAVRTPNLLPKAIKIAPAITGPITSTIARAAEPTKGQAWAFPDEDDCRIGPTPKGPTPLDPGPQYLDSRRSSVADSLTSSQFTLESSRSPFGLPYGQRSLDDLDNDYTNRPSTDQGLYRHHSQVFNSQLSLPHKQLSDLQHHQFQSDSSSVQLDFSSVQGHPYARTPANKNSHKLAERRRRLELKELYELLRECLPRERGSKASKQDLLARVITQLRCQDENIRTLQQHLNSSAATEDNLRCEVQGLRMENGHLRSELASPGSHNHHRYQIHQAHQAHQIHQTHRQTDQPHQQSVGPQPSYLSDPFTSRSDQLPPLRSISGHIPTGPGALTADQYGGLTRQP